MTKDRSAPSLAVALAVVDEMIQETHARTSHVGSDLERFGATLGIGVRLGILREVKDNLVKAGIAYYKEQEK